MQTVFDNDMTVHVWAQQSQAHGRSNNGNVSFRDSILFSYAQPIAAFAKGKGGESYVLRTSESFSITTSHHVGRVGSALPPGVVMFTVPYVVVASGHCRQYYQFDSDADMHAHNVEHLMEEVRDYGKRLTRFHATFWNITDADKAESALADFRRWQGGDGPRPSMTGLPAHERGVVSYAIECEGMAAKRAAWVAGEPVSYSDYQAPIALRVRGDKLETSQGASVPLSHAVKVFRFVKLVRERGESWQANGHAVRVGHFRVDSISADGDMIAGCHRIPWEETERVARVAGVYDESPDASACVSRETADA